MRPGRVCVHAGPVFERVVLRENSSQIFLGCGIDLSNRVSHRSPVSISAFAMPKPPICPDPMHASDNLSSEQSIHMDYGIGSRVRVKLCAGDIVTAEILVIFTASVKKILVEFAKKFMRVDPEQIIEVLRSA
jgi:hypothetical protein